MRELATGAFLAEQRNAVLVGGTGTGKSHLAIAIARTCIRATQRTTGSVPPCAKRHRQAAGYRRP